MTTTEEAWRRLLEWEAAGENRSVEISGERARYREGTEYTSIVRLERVVDDNPLAEFVTLTDCVYGDTLADAIKLAVDVIATYPEPEENES